MAGNALYILLLLPRLFPVLHRRAAHYLPRDTPWLPQPCFLFFERGCLLPDQR
ncbi:hypothetical protein D3C86_2266180 [compost metagenome]